MALQVNNILLIEFYFFRFQPGFLFLVAITGFQGNTYLAVDHPVPGEFFLSRRLVQSPHDPSRRPFEQLNSPSIVAISRSSAQVATWISCSSSVLFSAAPCRESPTKNFFRRSIICPPVINKPWCFCCHETIPMLASECQTKTGTQSDVLHREKSCTCGWRGIKR